MKEYPSIDGPSSGRHLPCYGFVKYDGSNMRFEWSKKRGWYKFGTRKEMIDINHPIFGEGIEVFLNKYGDELPKVFKNEKTFRGVRNFIVYGEYFGSESFAGSHKPNDPKDLVLFDVNPITKGFLGPKEFLDMFGHLPVAEVVFQGNFGPALQESVRKETIDLESKYEIKSIIPEGIICKGGRGHKLWRCKVKTERYKEALKVLYEADWEKYWE